MGTPRRSLPSTNKKNSAFSLPLNPGEGVQRYTVTNTSRNSSTYKGLPGSPSPNQSERRSKSKSIRFSDLIAGMYPGIKVGHKHCVEKVTFVPKTMGWLWNTEETVTGVPLPWGWRPGAIAIGVKRKLMRSRLMSEPLTVPPGSKGKKKRRAGKTDSTCTSKTTKTSMSSIAIDVPPTLCIQKEHGVYHVKMQPIKIAGDKDEDEEQPVQFKIADSVSSRSQQTKSSSSSLKIEYLCTGALRKPIKKPEITEMATQWDTADFEKKEHKKESDEKSSKKKSKRKISSGKEEIKKEDLTKEGIKKKDSKKEETKKQEIKTSKY